MMWFKSGLCCTVFLLCFGCITNKNLQVNINKFENLPQYWLTASLYAGQFFDDASLILVDHRPFHAIDDAQTKDGYIFYPPKETKIIPAGTRVRIIDIKYPDETNVLKRPIYSPRYQVWVYVKVAKERGDVTVFYEPAHVMIMPSYVVTEKEVQSYLNKFLSLEDPNRQILQLESYIQDGIFNKKPVIGMKKEHVFAALGPAIKRQVQPAINFEPAQEIWLYSDYYVTFIDEIVSKVKYLKP